MAPRRDLPSPTPLAARKAAAHRRAKAPTACQAGEVGTVQTTGTAEMTVQAETRLPRRHRRYGAQGEAEMEEDPEATVPAPTDHKPVPPTTTRVTTPSDVVKDIRWRTR